MKNFQDTAIFEGGSEGMLRAALKLLGAEKLAMVQLTREGRIESITPSASQALGLLEKDSIYERLLGVQAALLRDALEKGEEFCFSDHFGAYRMYDVTATPMDGGALLLLSPWPGQTMLEARIFQVTRDNMQSLLTAAYPMSANAATRYDVLRDGCGKLQELMENAAEPYGILREKAAELYQALRQDDLGRYQQMVKAVLKIERTLKHAEWLLSAKASDARPIFVTDDLAGMCRVGADAFRQRCRAQVEVRAPQELEAVYDPDWIMSALLNLLTNAVQADHIIITVSEQEKTVMIAVEDDGCGIPPDALQYLLNAWREEFQPELYNGVRPGLGLPLVRRIAERHGGCLLYEKLEQGQVFRVYLSSLLSAESQEVRSQSLAVSSFPIIDVELSVL